MEAASHPRLGTVEIRALDTQATARDTAAVAAAVHTLARHEAQAEPVEGPPGDVLDEASFRAARAGVEATLPDGEDRLRPVAELLEETIALVRPVARELRVRANSATSRGCLQTVAVPACSAPPIATATSKRCSRRSSAARATSRNKLARTCVVAGDAPAFAPGS